MVKYPWVRGERPPVQPQRGLRGLIRRHLSGIFVTVMVALLIVFVVYPYMVVTVPSGQVGVLWKRFIGPGIYCWCLLSRGTVLDPSELREEGLHVIWPWDTLFLYDLRLQATTEKYNAISKEGVSVTAEINIRYQLKHESVAVFHKFIGPGYLKSLLAPEIGSQARIIISQYQAQQVYISREQIEKQIQEAAQRSLGEHLNALFQLDASEQQNAEIYRSALQTSIQVLDTLMLSIELPNPIVAAINRQTEQYYQIQEYRYRAEREAEESKRKQIEANGIAAFQQTVSQGISDSYLRWRGIEATLALAQSQNAKIVVIGTGKDGLPIILGNVDNPPLPTNPANPSEKPGDGNTPPSGNPPKTQGASPATPNKNPGETTAENRPNASLDLSEIEALITRLADALRIGSGKSPETPETPANPK